MDTSCVEKNFRYYTIGFYLIYIIWLKIPTHTQEKSGCTLFSFTNEAKLVPLKITLLSITLQIAFDIRIFLHKKHFIPIKLVHRNTRFSESTGNEKLFIRFPEFKYDLKGYLKGCMRACCPIYISA